MQVQLQLNKAWLHQDAIWIIGFTFWKDKLLKELDFITLVAEHRDKLNDDFLCELNGQYAIIVKHQEYYSIVVDRIRTIPLFIYKDNNAIVIADAITSVSTINYSAVDTFQKIYCTLANDTLLKQWQQLPAGTYASLKNESNVINYVNYYQHKKIREVAFDEVQLKKLEYKIIAQLQQLSANNEVVVMLSGGYDSRYLLCLLMQYGVKNITCVTYGKSDSKEVTIAKEVTKQLDCPLIYVEYTQELLNQFLEYDWQNYSNQAFNFTSLPHEQDYFCLWYITQHQLISKDAWIVNGYCQDLHAGSIFEHTFSFNASNYIQKQYQVEVPNLLSWDDYQNWFVQNRVSKFIVNATTVYMHFNYNFYLPFWDADWIQFWYNLPFEQRLHQCCYNDYVFKQYFTQKNIAIKKEDNELKNWKYYLKKLIKLMIPKRLTEQIRIKNELSNDSNNSSFLYDKIYKQLKQTPPNKDYNINKLHALYIIEQTLIVNQKIKN